LTSFSPINDDHAVTSVLFGLHLDEFVEPPTIEAIRQSNPWNADLPAVTTLPLVEIVQGGQTYNVPAVQFAIVRPDSRPLWSLKFTGYDIVVECTAYSRWAEVWKTAAEYLTQAFSLVRSVQEDVNIADFRLQVTDQFAASVERYNVDDLFNPASQYLSPLALDGRQLWNSAVGWFEDQGNVSFSDMLSVQVQGHDNGTRIGAPYLVTIQHYGRATTAGEPVPEIDRLDDVISTLHLRNKAAVSDLISQTMRERIGLLP